MAGVLRYKAIPQFAQDNNGQTKGRWRDDGGEFIILERFYRGQQRVTETGGND